MSPSTTGPVKSVRPLWPGIWNGNRSDVISRIQASRSGASERNPIGSFGSKSVAAPKACSDNHLAFKKSARKRKQYGKTVLKVRTFWQIFVQLKRFFRNQPSPKS